MPAENAICKDALIDDGTVSSIETREAAVVDMSKASSLSTRTVSESSGYLGSWEFDESDDDSNDEWSSAVSELSSSSAEDEWSSAASHCSVEDNEDEDVDDLDLCSDSSEGGDDEDEEPRLNRFLRVKKVSIIDIRQEENLTTSISRGIAEFNANE
ncbi:hypothetical protein ONZ45_g8921 [Pleurotus djamor]|nr:hypothetical protein ONZ45_g8921 [Pleurotus djamor]